jgi:hypothetical protein
MAVSIIWEPHPTFPLQLVASAVVDSDNDDYLAFLTDRWGDNVHAWCKEHNCGTRMSFDTYKFRNEAEQTFFLTKWA